MANPSFTLLIWTLATEPKRSTALGSYRHLKTEHGDEEEPDVWLEADWDDGYDPEDDIVESDIIQAQPMNFEWHSNR